MSVSGLIGDLASFAADLEKEREDRRQQGGRLARSLVAGVFEIGAASSQQREVVVGSTPTRKADCFWDHRHEVFCLLSSCSARSSRAAMATWRSLVGLRCSTPMWRDAHARANPTSGPGTPVCRQHAHEEATSVLWHTSHRHPRLGPPWASFAKDLTSNIVRTSRFRGRSTENFCEFHSVSHPSSIFLLVQDPRSGEGSCPHVLALLQLRRLGGGVRGGLQQRFRAVSVVVPLSNGLPLIGWRWWASRRQREGITVSSVVGHLADTLPS
ncbi:hypothetical protein IWX90DRAFT_206872 [Phyllosticta citrichinensis]|uniref:Uncharacterized protein n=1 Tax=Phyllosticta citrichinensis TaxID=1130410 RepID=A0ABR1XSS6_9PEZI